MDKPFNCHYCKFCRHIPCSDGQREYCYAVNDFIEDVDDIEWFCPLIEIKEPHGALIDREALLYQFSPKSLEKRELLVMHATDPIALSMPLKLAEKIVQTINAEPVIIEAEG